MNWFRVSAAIQGAVDFQLRPTNVAQPADNASARIDDRVAPGTEERNIYDANEV